MQADMGKGQQLPGSHLLAGTHSAAYASHMHAPAVQHRPWCSSGTRSLSMMLLEQPNAAEGPTHALVLLCCLLMCCACCPANPALHSHMERVKTVVRVCKAAFKKPHSRSNADITHIAAETQSLTLLTREGPAVHRELCHVLQALTVSQMQSVRLPGEFKSSIMVYVSMLLLQ
eukprot:GHRQ01021858.1.p1 GENE.GHRQ01021858.1~~GHRQ01021858.1.p1  ORF type:complete len:173 (-),score=57.38 GHRQ01021858.1:194-712(-)